MPSPRPPRWRKADVYEANVGTGSFKGAPHPRDDGGVLGGDVVAAGAATAAVCCVCVTNLQGWKVGKLAGGNLTRVRLGIPGY